MNIQAERYRHAVILILEGELTEDSLSAFKQAVNAQIGEAPDQQDTAQAPRSNRVIDLVLNLEKVPFIDSAAMEYLLELQEFLTERLGRVKFAAADENILKILEITRLESTFEVFGDVPEAVKVMQT